MSELNPLIRDIVKVAEETTKLNEFIEQLFLVLSYHLDTKNYFFLEDGKVVFEIKESNFFLPPDIQNTIGPFYSEKFCLSKAGNYLVAFDVNKSVSKSDIEAITTLIPTIISHKAKFDFVYKHLKYLKSLVYAIEPLIYETDIRQAILHSIISITTFTDIERIFVASTTGNKMKVISSVEVSYELMKRIEYDYRDFVEKAITEKREVTFEIFEGSNKFLATVIPLGDIEKTKGIMFASFKQGKNEISEIDKEILRIISFLVTHRLKLHEINEYLVKARKEAERLSKLKSEFVANVSHELRTPLNAILGFIELIKIGNFPKEEELKYLDYISMSATSLLNMINNILDLSKIESGKIEVHFENVNLRELLTEVYKSSKILCLNKGIELRMRLEKSLPQSIKTDQMMLRSILTNLLSNAIKFTENGYVRLDVYRRNNFIIFRVEDTGVGMKEEDINKIFDAFVQLESVRNKRFPGTGIGLSVSQKFAQMLGGKIIPKTKGIGKGSIFFLVLPLRT